MQNYSQRKKLGEGWEISAKMIDKRSLLVKAQISKKALQPVFCQTNIVRSPYCHTSCRYCFSSVTLK